MVGRPGSAELYDARRARRAVEVPTAATELLATANTSAVLSGDGYGGGQPALIGFADGSRKEYGPDASNGTRSNGGGKGGRRDRQRPQTSVGSRRTAYQCIVDLLPPVATTTTTATSPKRNQNLHLPTNASGSAKTGPTSGPRQLTSGGGAAGGGGGRRRRRARAGESVPTELIMPTVSLCLGGIDDCVEPLVDSSPDGHHSFDRSARGSQHTRRRASPASLLAQATAAASPAGGARPHLSGRPADRACGGGGGGGGGDGGDGGCIRPVEPTAVGGVDRSAARSHGFRRWRPGESGPRDRARG